MCQILKMRRNFYKCLYRRFFFIYLPIFAILCSACYPSATPTTGIPDHRSEILWDTWGVPHIYAKDDVGLFYAFGQAQMESHANLLLRLYGQARGRAAEYWGSKYLGSDLTADMMNFSAHAQQWYIHQSPEFRSYLNAFAAGINDYAQQHPAQISNDVKIVLPVHATDILAHLERLLFIFLTGNTICHTVLNAGEELGSNAWAIAPSHSTEGQAMLLSNPHLPWSSVYTLYEAQLTAPDIAAYGATYVGLPVMVFAFNSNLGWTHTINTINGCTLYQLTLAQQGYIFDHQIRAFTTRMQTIRIKQANGAFKSDQIALQYSIHGPVIQRGREIVALRVVGVDQFPAYGALQEWWDMARAKKLSEFETVLQRLQIPMFTVIYADRDGHIFSLFNGQVPIHSSGDWSFWSHLVPGDTSSTLWTKIHPYRDLPKVIDPSGGWVQNSNSPPWATTLPPELDPTTYPPYMAPQFVNIREQYGIDMLRAASHLSFEDMIRDKFSTHTELADRLVPDLVVAARHYGDNLANRAADVLQAWNRQTDATSRGAVLFYLWVQQVQQAHHLESDLFAVPWEASDPLTTPKNLAHPSTAVTNLELVAKYAQSHFGALDISWGDVFRLHRGNVDLPASGGSGGIFGIFRALYFTPAQNGQFDANDGDSFIAAVKFSQPVQAKVLMTYGNSSQPTSPHYGDQLKLYEQNQLRTAWLTRIEIMKHLESHEVFDLAHSFDEA